MSVRSFVGGLSPQAAGSSCTSGGVSPGSTYLSGLDRFIELLDGQDPHSAGYTAASAAILLSVDYFQLGRDIDHPCALAPVAGWTWSQALWSVMELARHTASWVLDRELDPAHDRLVHQWNESIALAMLAELTARTHLLPCPYLAFEAGMLVAAVGMSEQLRLLEQDDRCQQAMLGQSTIRQLENMVLQNKLIGSLSLIQVVRKGSYLGPWPALSLAHRLARPQVGLAWLAGLIEQVELLPSTRVLEKSLRMRIRSQWPEFVELAERIWQTAVALERRGR